MRERNLEDIIVVMKDGKLVAVYAVADKEAGIEVRLEKGVDYEVWEY